MTEPIFVQLTPIPQGLRPPTPEEQATLAAEGKQDPLTSFLEGEREAFELWANGVPRRRTSFNIVHGYTTKFGLFAGPLPDADDESPVARHFHSLTDGIFTGAVYGDTGTELYGVPFSSRARWLVDESVLNNRRPVIEEVIKEVLAEREHERTLYVERRRRIEKKMMLAVLIWVTFVLAVLIFGLQPVK